MRAADQQLLSLLAPEIWRKLSSQQRSRCIWRIGERRLKLAVPRLVKLLEQGEAMQDYCLAYAIGRCGDVGAVEAMHVLQQRSKHDAVRRMALHAWLQLADTPQREQYFNNLLDSWPARLRTAWQVEDEVGVHEALKALNENGWQTLLFSNWLEQLDHVASTHPFARKILLTILRTVAIKPGVFRALRHLYKAAEFRADAEIFGILHQRFETTPGSVPHGNRWVRIERRYVRFMDEVVRADSRVAYSANTRDYLRRRSWRTLRRLAVDDTATFIKMAVGALLAMHDSDAAPFNEYAQASKHKDGRLYGPYSRWLLLNRLLHTDWHSNRLGSSWYRFTPLAENHARQEAFAEIWDQHPEALLNLLERSQCQAVHTFAARALSDNPSFCTQIGLPVLANLLHSPYLNTARFAFQLCRQHFENSQLEHQWLLLMLQSNLPEAHQYALDSISRNAMAYCADTALLLVIICSPSDLVRSQARLLCQLAQTMPQQSQALCEHLLEWLENCQNDAASSALLNTISADLLWLLDHPLQEAARHIASAPLIILLQHPVPEVQVLAGEWLSRHIAVASLISVSTLKRLLQSEHAALRTVGVKLFGSLPDHILLNQVELLLSFCLHAEPSIRQAISPSLSRLANDSSFAEALMPSLIEALFRSESGPNLHADLLQWLQGPLHATLSSINQERILKLLQAKSRGAQQLGVFLLPRLAASDFSIRQWAALANNENAEVRQTAMRAFVDQVELVKANMRDGLRIFDSVWPDCLDFACDFFSQQCSAEDWTPLLLVSLCDHLEAQVQAFGRRMLAQHFHIADITETILKLSQHPSPNMQLFVSDYLAKSVGNNAQHLQQLSPYFVTVLSQVNRGRVLKNRLLDFLRQQAQSSEAMAAVVAPIFARQVVTVAIVDKAQYIEGLQEIERLYPNLAPILNKVEVSKHPARFAATQPKTGAA